MFQIYFRHLCISLKKPILTHLKTRSLIRVSGSDAAALLQGLVTNDIQHLNNEANTMYAMFLNNKGRVLYDTIIYQMPEENTYCLEVDSNIVDSVKKHLSFYRLRRKVQIETIDDKYKVWSCFNPSNPTENKIETEELVFTDPRLKELGSRIIARVGTAFPEASPDGDSAYKQYRYKLGVGEGVEELPPGNCFPLEANCDYLHGVSFQKGCYIGQELTARTFHTGVTRKRLMPLHFESKLQNVPKLEEIIKGDDANVGKLRGIQQDCGLGLLRIQQALKSKKLLIQDTEVRTEEPSWWPKNNSSQH